MEINHIFGPVPSRRLGISLGIDIIPFKTCTLDCVYCECGKTNNLTIKRDSFVDTDTIIAELKTVFLTHKHIEYITFSGSGEPTLNRDIGTLIKEIKQISEIPIAVLTNGTLFYLEEVRKDLQQADLVLPSLDAVSKEVFQKINQPDKNLDINAIIEGLITFSKEFSGKIWLEVFIIDGINSGDPELNKLYNTIKKINPHKVQLNSVDRPPAYNVKPVEIGTLEQIMSRWNDLPIEIIKRIRKRKEIASFSKNLENSILNTINRRPLMIEDLIELTGKSRLELFKYIDVLEKEKKIFSKIVEDKIFYTSAAHT